MSLEIRSEFLCKTVNKVELKRFSDQFNIKVTIDFLAGPNEVKSSSKFVNSILSKLDGFNVKIETVDLENPLVIENIGYAFGEALSKAHELRKAKNMVTYIHTDNNMMGMFALSKEKNRGEANLQIIGEATLDPEHFFVFFDGFAQGICMDFNAVINFGKRKNDQIKFISKTFGSVLEKIFHKEYNVYDEIENFD